MMPLSIRPAFLLALVLAMGAGCDSAASDEESLREEFGGVSLGRFVVDAQGWGRFEGPAELRPSAYTWTGPSIPMRADTLRYVHLRFHPGALLEAAIGDTLAVRATGFQNEVGDGAFYVTALDAERLAGVFTLRLKEPVISRARRIEGGVHVLRP